MVVTDASHMVAMTDRMKRADVLPITPERYKRIMIVHLKGNGGAMAELMKAMGYGGGNPAEALKEKLCAKGFDAFIYESPLDIMKKQMAAGEKPNINLYFAGEDAFTAIDPIDSFCGLFDARL